MKPKWPSLGVLPLSLPFHVRAKKVAMCSFVQSIVAKHHVYLGGPHFFLFVFFRTSFCGIQFAWFIPLPMHMFVLFVVAGVRVLLVTDAFLLKKPPPHVLLDQTLRRVFHFEYQQLRIFSFIFAETQGEYRGTSVISHLAILCCACPRLDLENLVQNNRLKVSIEQDK